MINPDVSEGIPEGFPFTQSNLQDFVDCPRRFYLRHIRRQAWPAPLAEPQAQIEQAMRRGSRFHTLAERNLSGVMLDKLMASAIDDPVLQGWLRFYRDYIQQLGQFERQWVEELLGTGVVDYPLMAKFDFIGLRNSELLAIDWKTGKLPARRILEKRMQTAVYLLVLYRQSEILARHPVETMHLRYVSVSTGSVQEFEVNAEIAASVEQTISRIIDRIQVSAFEKVPDTGPCRYCNYRSLCDRGTVPIVEAVDIPDILDIDVFQSLEDENPDDTIEF